MVVLFVSVRWKVAGNLIAGRPASTFPLGNLVDHPQASTFPPRELLHVEYMELFSDLRAPRMLSGGVYDHSRLCLCRHYQQQGTKSRKNLIHVLSYFNAFSISFPIISNTSLLKPVFSHTRLPRRS